MILATTYATGQVPFKHVYLHGLVRAEDGKKMSKSRPESIIDPLSVIPKYGTDALRMALIMGVSPGNDQKWAWSKIEANRNFCNKLWNIARYIEALVGDSPRTDAVEPSTAADHWILSMLRSATEKIHADLDDYRFSEAYETLYHFVWDDLADWYIEASKAQPNLPLLAHVLEAVLLLTHPFAPFVTETIWQTLAWEQDTILAGRTYKPSLGSDEQQAAAFTEIQHIVTETRAILKALKVSEVSLFYNDAPFLGENATIITKLAGLKAVEEAADGTGMFLTSTSYRCWLNIDKQSAQSYVTELENQAKNQTAGIEQLEKRLANKAYTENAPPAVVEETKQQLAEARLRQEAITTEMQRFRIL